MSDAVRSIDSARNSETSFEVSDAPACRYDQDRERTQPSIASSEDCGRIEKFTPPVRFMLWRMLAERGERSLIARLAAAAESAPDIADADALVEASLPGDFDIDRIAARSASASLLSPETANAWRTLLVAERAIATGSIDRGLVTDLLALEKLEGGTTEGNYDASVRSWVAMRALAAAVRAVLGLGETDADLTRRAAARLPSWEADYVQGLHCWAAAEIEAAAERLENSVKSAPCQTPPRFALAILLSESEPPKTLALTECDAPTRELTIVRVSLLARLHRFEEAEEELKRIDAEGSLGREPLRHRWAAGSSRIARMERRLRIALAERRGDWRAASRALAAEISETTEGFRKIRSFYQAAMQCGEKSGAGGWEAGLNWQRFESGVHQFGSIRLSGDELFLRCAALAANLPDQAAKDAEQLLARKHWIDKERRAGGDRLIFAADAALRGGRIDAAIRGYEACAGASQHETKARAAIALVYTKLVSQSERGEIERAADRALEIAKRSAWPQLLAAAGLVLEGSQASARARLQTAAKLGAPQNLVDLINALIDLLEPNSGACSAPPKIELPRELKQYGELLFGEGTFSERAEAFIAAAGEKWIECSPMEPDVIGRHAAAGRIKNGELQRAIELAHELEKDSSSNPTDLKLWLELLAALKDAAAGKLDESEATLKRLRRENSKQT